MDKEFQAISSNPDAEADDMGASLISEDFERRQTSPKSILLYAKTNSSIITIGFVIFLGDSSRGVLFPVLWNLCKELGGTLKDLGYLVAMFSLGRLIVTVPLGYFCDKYRHKLSLQIAAIVLFAGSILWANAYTTKSLAALYVAQLLMGFGSGSLGVTRSYVVEQCKQESRTDVLAVMTALQYAGFTCSPLIGSLFAHIGGQSSLYWSYALPAYFLGLLVWYSLIAISTCLEDIQLVPKNPIPPQASVRSPAFSVLSATEITKIVGTLIVLNVTTKGSISVYETMGMEIATTDYAISNVLFGSIVTICGSVGFVNLLFFKQIWTSRFNDVELILIMTMIMILGQLIYFAYWGKKPTVGAFLVCIVLFYAIGYPVGHTAVLGAFSKIQKSGPQAALLGWFASAGSLSRIIIPLISGNLDIWYDNSPFLVVILLLCSASVLTVHFRPRIEHLIGATEGHDDVHRSLSTREKWFVGSQMTLGLFASIAMFVSSEGSGRGSNPFIDWIGEGDVD